MTHREYRTRLQWIDDQYDKPSRSDYYLMQIASEVAKVLSKKPRRIKIKHYLLQFNEKRKSKTTDSKSAWFQILGINHDRQTTGETDR